MRVRYSKNRAIGDALFVPQIMAELAGQLMVYEHEAKGVKGPKQQPMRNMLEPSVLHLELGDGQDTRAFLNKPWTDAIDWFKERGLVDDDELSRLLRDYAEQTQEARRLMLEQVQQRVYAGLEQALTEGQTFEQFADALAEDAPGLGISADDPAYLQNVFRTNIMSAYGGGRHRALSDPDVVAALPYRIIRTAGDARVRDGEHGGEDHVQLDGLAYEANGPLKDLKTPFGFQCFPGDVVVQGTFNVAMRALYRGEILQITTNHGRRLAVTPNHPIATVNGFVAACAIRKGDQLLCYERAVHLNQLATGATVRPDSTDVNEHQAPTAIEDVFGAFVRAGRRDSSKGDAQQFHGDALFFESDVDVVWADRKLPNGLESGTGEDSGNLRLAATHLATETNEARERGLGFHGLRYGSPTRSPPRGSALPIDGRRVLFDFGPLHQLGIGSAANLHASRYEYAADGGSRDAKFVRDLLLGACGVSTDYVVSVERESFHNYVYDLQSPYGWLVASGIVTSNCRCSITSAASWDGDIITEMPPNSLHAGFGF